MRVALVVVTLAAGCTQHRHIVEAHEVATDEVVVERRGGQQSTAVGVRTAGGITFYDKASGGTIPSAEVVKVIEVSHGRGALQGLPIGIAIGTAVGAIAGYASGDDDCSSRDSDCFFILSAKEKAFFGGLLLGAAGGLVGLVVGGIKGSTTIYELPGANVSVRVGGPAGSTAGLTIAF